jgi:hypothetical protein
MMREFIYILLFITTTSFANATPQEVLENYFSYIKKHDFVNASKSIHTTELHKFKKLMLKVFRAIPKSKQKDFFSSLKYFKNLQDATALSPRQFYINFLKSTNAKKSKFFRDIQETEQVVLGLLYDDKTNTQYIAYRYFNDNKKNIKNSKIILQPVAKEGKEFKLLITTNITNKILQIKQSLPKS